MKRLEKIETGLRYLNLDYQVKQHRFEKPLSIFEEVFLVLCEAAICSAYSLQNGIIYSCYFFCILLVGKVYTVF